MHRLSFGEMHRLPRPAITTCTTRNNNSTAITTAKILDFDNGRSPPPSVGAVRFGAVRHFVHVYDNGRSCDFTHNNKECGPARPRARWPRSCILSTSRPCVSSVRLDSPPKRPVFWGVRADSAMRPNAESTESPLCRTSSPPAKSSRHRKWKRRTSSQCEYCYKLLQTH